MDLLKSRRFWLTVSGCLLVVLTDGLGMSDSTSREIVALIIAAIVGDSWRQMGNHKSDQ